MSKIKALAFLIVFYFFWISIRTITSLFTIIRFRYILKWIHKIRGVQLKVIYVNGLHGAGTGYKYRTEKWMELLKPYGFHSTSKVIFDHATWKRLLSREYIYTFHVKGLIEKINHILSTVNYSSVIVTRELLAYNDYGNLFMEKFLRSIHYNLILDFDDDLDATFGKQSDMSFYDKLLLRKPRKLNASFRFFDNFFCGSNYLKGLVLDAGIMEDKIRVIPTCVDYPDLQQKNYSSSKETIDIGWVGSIYNLKYLDILLPALNELSQEFSIRLLIVSGKDYIPPMPVTFDIVNVAWSLEKETDNIRLIDIGVMPLNDTPEERGKCGFKLIQYMGLGIVSAANAVTVNNEIIDEGLNGFLVKDNKDWAKVLRHIIKLREEFDSLGKESSKKIRDHYTFKANINKYLEFLI